MAPPQLKFSVFHSPNLCQLLTRNSAKRLECQPGREAKKKNQPYEHLLCARQVTVSGRVFPTPSHLVHTTTPTSKGSESFHGASCLEGSDRNLLSSSAL